MKFSAKKSVLGTMGGGLILLIIFSVLIILLIIYVLGTMGGRMGGGLILWIIFSVLILIIPLIILIFKIISIKSYTLTIDGTKITEHGGIFNKYDRQTLLTNVVGVDVSQTFFGRIFGYGNVHVDLVGKRDLWLNGIKQPDKLKEFLQQYVNTENLSTLLTN